MRRLQLFVATSLDGYVAGPDGDLSWRRAGAELFAAAWASVDTVLMGRHTYADGAAWRSGERRVVVFGRDDDPSIATAHTVGTSRTPPDVIGELRAREGGALALVAGGALTAACFAAGLVDDVFVVVHPVLLGGGTPLLGHDAATTTLATLSERRHPSGVVQIAYRVERGDPIPD